MIHDIHLARTLEWLILHKRLGYAENVKTISGHSSNEYDTKVSQSLSSSPHNCQSVHYIKIVGVVQNPFFLCDNHTNKAELCTKEQFQSGKEELLERIERLFECKSEEVVLKYDGATEKSKKCINIKDARDEVSQTDLERK